MYKIKKGAAFKLVISAFNGELPFDVSPYTIECNLYDGCGNLVESLIAEKVLENNKFLLKSNNTANWPLGYATFEFDFVLNGESTYSDDFLFKVIPSGRYRGNQ